MHASHAKINLGLKVNFKYPNDYHDINSLLIPIDLLDKIDILFGHDKKLDRVRINWKDNLPEFFSSQLKTFFEPQKIKNNIIYISCSWFFDWFEKTIQMRSAQSSRDMQYSNAKASLKDLRDSQIIIQIDKRIPSPAGLGGGSSNAAAIFKGLLKKVSSISGMEYQVLLEILSKEVVFLGADIPFFLQDKAALISGIGNIEKQLEIPKSSGILGIPNYSFETQKVYQGLNIPLQEEYLFKNSNRSGIRRFEEYLQSTVGPIINKKEEVYYSRESRLCFVENDLLSAAESVYPKEVFSVKNSMEVLAQMMLECSDTKSNIYTSMSGSGASFFAMGDISREIQEELLLKLKKDHSNINWYVFSTL